MLTTSNKILRIHSIGRHHPVRHCYFLLALTFALLSFHQSALAINLSTEVDRTVIGADETLQLTVRLDEQIISSGPDLSPLQQNFDILNQMRSNQFRNINGRAESWTEWTLVLAPKNTGKLLIPSLNYKNAYSDAISITVTPPGQTINGEVPDVFVETKVDKKSVYVQEQILLTYNIHVAQSAGNLRDISMQELQLPGAVSELVAENTFRRSLKGRSFYVKELVYAIYPQQSARLEIPSLMFALTLNRGSRGWNDPFRMSRGDIRRLKSETMNIDVNPKPDNYHFDNWIPARNVIIEENWSNKSDTYRVGEPITRTITLNAEGLTAAQLPPLPEQGNDSVKVYADQPQQTDEKSATGITGRRIESVAIVPTESGILTLPAVELGWWDTINQRQRVARLPARQLKVAAAAADSANLAPPALTRDSSSPVQTEPTATDTRAEAWPWIIATAVCATFAFGFMIAWLRAKRFQQPGINPQERQRAISVKAAANQVRRACADNDPAAARKAVIEWGQLYWQDQGITQLQAIIQRSQHGGLKRELELLDKTLYGHTANNKNDPLRWQGEALWKVMQGYRKLSQRQTKTETDALAPLYPM